MQNIKLPETPQQKLAEYVEMKQWSHLDLRQIAKIYNGLDKQNVPRDMTERILVRLNMLANNAAYGLTADETRRAVVDATRREPSRATAASGMPFPPKA